MSGRHRESFIRATCATLVWLANLAFFPRSAAAQVDCSQQAARYADAARMRRECSQGDLERKPSDPVRQACERRMDAAKAQLDALYAQCGARGRANSANSAAPPAAANLQESLAGLANDLQRRQDERSAEREANEARLRQERREQAEEDARQEEREERAEARREAAREARKQRELQAMTDAFNTAAESSPHEVKLACKANPDFVQLMVGTDRFQELCCADATTIGGGAKIAYLTGGAAPVALATGSDLPYPTVRVEYSTKPAIHDGCPAWQLASPIVLIAHNYTPKKLHLDYGWTVTYAPPGDIASLSADLTPARNVHVDLPPGETQIDEIVPKGTVMRTDSVEARSLGSQVGFEYMAECTQLGNPGDCGAGTCADFGAQGKHCTRPCSQGCPTPSTGCGRTSMCKP
jgi:hypothetical protein